MTYGQARSVRSVNMFALSDIHSMIEESCLDTFIESIRATIKFLLMPQARILTSLLSDGCGTATYIVSVYLNLSRLFSASLFS